MRPQQEVSAIRPLAVLVLFAACGAASAYFETHANEITAPLAGYATARVAALTALPTRTKTEKRELAQLKALGKKLDKPQFLLKGDFAELSAAAKTFVALKTSGAPMQAPLDEGFVRAGLSLSERVELAQDHLDLLSNLKHKKTVQTLMTSIATARAKAAAATTAAKRAAFLVTADALVTKTLKTAENFVGRDLDNPVFPPTRYRSGDAVDRNGGRVAIPRDSGSPLAGASIVIPQGAFLTPTVVTLSAAPSFVGGRDVAAFPSALSVGPEGLVLPAGAVATVTVPFTPNPEQSPQALALFAAGPPTTSILPVQTHVDLTISADVASISTFQSGYAAPPPGQPNGAYHVQMLAFDTALSSALTDSGLRVGILQQTFTFRADHTASTSLPGFSTAARTFTAAAPHHLDEPQSQSGGPVDFAWTAGPAGRFSFTFRLAEGLDAHAEAVASDDGRVVSFSGRAGAFDFFGVGVRGGATAGVSDLGGRWAAVEAGAQFLDDGAEPFTTRYFDALRSFTVDASGVVTFDASGAQFETDVTCHTDLADPVHSRAENVLADSGTETWTVSTVDGFVGGAQNRRFGWLDKEAGFLLTSYYDAAARRVSMMLAVPQPLVATPSALPGTYHWAQFDVGTSVGIPSARSSAHKTTPSVGSLVVDSVDAATLSLDATTLNIYTLTGDPPLSAMTWGLTLTALPQAASSVPIALSLDAAGNHRVDADERWFAFSGDGRYALGMTRGEAQRLARGLALGVR